MDQRSAPILRDADYLHRINHLDLFYSTLGPEGMAVLESARWIGNLRYLHLGANQIGDAGAAVLARMKLFARLEVLILSGNNISDRGAAELAHGCFPQGMVLHLNNNARISPAMGERLRSRFRLRI
jgi:Leucine Rich repeat